MSETPHTPRLTTRIEDIPKLPVGGLWTINLATTAYHGYIDSLMVYLSEHGCGPVSYDWAGNVWIVYVRITPEIVDIAPGLHDIRELWLCFSGETDVC